MKQLASLFLLIVLLGCQKEGVEAGMTPDPIDPALLYRTWQTTQITTDGQAQDNAQPTVVTLPQDGNIRGDQPDDINWCCKPSRFEVSGNTLKFVYQTVSSCAAVFCAPSPLRGDVTWQITTLTDTSLVLTSGKYQAGVQTHTLTTLP